MKVDSYLLFIPAWTESINQALKEKIECATVTCILYFNMIGFEMHTTVH